MYSSLSLTLDQTQFNQSIEVQPSGLPGAGNQLGIVPVGDRAVVHRRGSSFGQIIVKS